MEHARIIYLFVLNPMSYGRARYGKLPQAVRCSSQDIALSRSKKFVNVKKENFKFILPLLVPFSSCSSLRPQYSISLEVKAINILLGKVFCIYF